MFSLFSQSDSDTYALVLDIGSASVGGAIVAYREEKEPKIVYATRADMAFQEEFDFDRFQTALKQALQEVVARIERNAWQHVPLDKRSAKHIDHAYCFISAPWYVAKTQTITKAEDKPFKIDESRVQTEIADAVEAFKKQEDVQELIGAGEAEIVEQSVINILLNGYHIEHPYGKEVSEMQMTFLASIAPADVKQIITNEVGRAFTRAEISFHTFPLAAFHTIRSIAADGRNFLFLDISGEITDVLLVCEDAFQRTETFPIGKKTIVRALAKKLNTSPSEARSLIRMYQGRRLAGTQEAEVQQAIEAEYTRWHDQFIEVLKDFQNGAVIPKDIYVAADPDVVHFFADSIEDEERAPYAVADGTFDVQIMNPAFFSGLCRFDKSVTPDPFLMLEAVYADTLDTI